MKSNNMRFAAALCGAAILFGSAAMPTTEMPSAVVYAASAVAMTESGGFFESAYCQWAPVDNAEGYNVYCNGSRIDSMLIRQYSGYYRADVVGLAAGSYTLKVVPVISGSEDAAKAAEVNVTVTAHEREGYAFANGKAMGAYNGDGTLKANAIVIYVTDANKDSVTAEIDPDGKGAQTVTGLQNIITAYKKGKETRPMAIRFIGNITDPGSMAKGDLLVDTVTAGMTLEGIGNDATMNGFGIVLKNSSNVEVRNLGFMNCNSSEGDNCGLQQSNSYCWVHNCDFFYGDAGSDADQVKGDGALDTKKSHHITHSYNHFWDSGKCNLQGANGSDTSNYITYHHNWYDHSDSRHPRVRVATVHVYNNYYDGNAKYGIGSTTDSDIFAENNYFRNCNKPMLISTQGSDTTGTLSSETGGIIKAFGNVIVGAGSFIPYSQSSSSFDCYDASSRSEQVPSSVKAANGGATYNNFDTASDMYSYSVDAAEDVPAIVEAWAGRINGGDFQWQFDDSVEDTNSDVITALKSALVSYDDSIVAIGSGSYVAPSPDDNPITTTAPDGSSTSATTTTTTTNGNIVTDTPVTSGYIHNFTEHGTSSSFYSITGNLSDNKGSMTYGGLNLTTCLKMESATSIAFATASAATLTLVMQNGTSFKVDGNSYDVPAGGVFTMDIAAGAHTITKGDGSVFLYYMAVSTDDAPVSSTTTTTTTTTTTSSTSESTVTATLAGDVNCDGDVKVGDVILLNRFIAEDSTAAITETGMANAEVDGVSGINGGDATAILKLLAGL